MQLPTVTPMNDITPDTVMRYLTEIRNNLSNMGSGDASRVLSDYQQWVSSSAETLGYAFDHAAIDQLILTRRSWYLMQSFRLFGEADNSATIHRTFGAERTDRVRVLDELIAKYRSIEMHWTKSGDKFVVPDTNFFLHHDVLFDEAKWPAIAKTAIGEPVRILILIAVIRELDRQKIVGRATKVGKTQEDLRTRARRTLRQLHELFDDPNKVPRLDQWTSIELIQDPLSHRPLTSADTEIIDRCLAAKRVSGKDVHLLTGDLAMRLTARAEGLKVLDAP